MRFNSMLIQPIFVCMLVLLLVGVSNIAQAQEITPLDSPTVVVPTATPSITLTPAPPTITPTPRVIVPDFIFTWSEEMIYPAAVRFTLTVARPISQVVGLSLAIDAPGQATRQITVNANESAVARTDTFTDFVYLWRIPANNPLPFQAEVSYAWTVTVDPEQTAIVPGAFAFTDPNINWVVDDDPAGNLGLIYPEDTVAAALIRSSAAEVYNVLRVNTGRAPTFNLVLTDPNYPFDPCDAVDDTPNAVTGLRTGTTVACTTDVMGGVLNALDYELFEVDSLVGAPVREDVIREMVARFYEPDWRDSDVPQWFRTGLAYLYQPSDKSALLETVRGSYRLYRPFSLSQMNTPDAENRFLWDAQSYTMVLYIAERIGLERLFALAQTDTPFAEAYQTILDEPLEALIPTWRNWIFSDVAASGAQLTLYQGATSVPLPTQTATPYPPTPTHTPTDTPTATPTETPFGFLATTTALPSITPTPTERSRAATRTPRPASFALTPTAAPIVQAAEATTNDEGIDPRLLVIGGAGVLLIAVFAIYFVTSPRQ